MFWTLLSALTYSPMTSHISSASASPLYKNRGLPYWAIFPIKKSDFHIEQFFYQKKSSYVPYLRSVGAFISILQNSINGLKVLTPLWSNILLCFQQDNFSNVSREIIVINNVLTYCENILFDLWRINTIFETKLFFNFF